MIDFTPSLIAKGFFRFTGPPENWLTAIKFMTWGLEEKLHPRWEKIQPGDIFFIHSTGPQTSLFENARSGIIGLGVVGPNFSIKNNYLWIREFEEKRNIWPLLVPFSEIYLFSELPPRESWVVPSSTNIQQITNLVDRLLKNYIPLASLQGFPRMGSFSPVSKTVSEQILYDKRPLYIYTSEIALSTLKAKPTRLEEIKSASETLRYAETLRVFDTIRKRMVRETPGQYTRDNELLARAEAAHSTILEELIEIFRNKGYETRSNKHVDLFAYNKERSFLFEVKSTENKNFISQARKGLIQLFEYDYFEIRKFTSENKFDFKDKYKILVPSQIPKDTNYVGFINDLKTGVAVVKDRSIKPVGADFGFSKI